MSKNFYSSKQLETSVERINQLQAEIELLKKTNEKSAIIHIKQVMRAYGLSPERLKFISQENASGGSSSNYQKTGYPSFRPRNGSVAKLRKFIENNPNVTKEEYRIFAENNGISYNTALSQWGRLRASLADPTTPIQSLEAYKQADNENTN